MTSSVQLFEKTPILQGLTRHLRNYRLKSICKISPYVVTVLRNSCRSNAHVLVGWRIWQIHRAQQAVASAAMVGRGLPTLPASSAS